MLEIVKDADYNGYIGIEFEGPDMQEIEGVQRSRDLLLQVRQDLS